MFYEVCIILIGSVLFASGLLNIYLYRVPRKILISTREPIRELGILEDMLFGEHNMNEEELTKALSNQFRKCRESIQLIKSPSEGKKKFRRSRSLSRGLKSTKSHSE